MTEPNFFLLLGSVDMLQVHHHSHLTQQSHLTIMSQLFLSLWFRKRCKSPCLWVLGHRYLWIAAVI